MKTRATNVVLPLVDKMEYYIRPEQPETDFLRIGSPEEIKICDPACGSGHMLTYAFDLLYAIYEEQGYQATEIPRLILTHNLYGIEIDERAGALAAFALTMKARGKDRRFFTRGRSSSTDTSGTRGSAHVTQPNICVLENIHIDPDDLSAYMNKVGHNLFSGGLQGVVNQWEEADNFGSLIRPLVTDVSEVLELLRERQMGADLFLAGVHQKVLTALRQADYLSSKYHVVVANPPYMGGRLMNPAMKTFSRKYFEESRFDAFAMFLVRGIELAIQKGRLAMVTMQSWMFLPSFAGLRQSLLKDYTIPTLAHLGPRAFPTISGEVVQTCAFVVEKLPNPDHRPTFIRLFDGDSEDKRVSLCAGQSRITSMRQREFNDIPLSPLVYWISEQARRSFARGHALSEIGMPRQGNTTTDNNRFVRSWFEVSRSKLGFGLESLEEFAANSFKWAPYNKGGGTRKWYGLNESVVNWERNGAEIKAIPHAVIANESLYMRDGITWSTISSSKLGFRSFGNGFIFDNKGACLFLDENLKEYLLALLNSRISKTLLIDFVPTVSIQPGDVGRLPVIFPKELETQKEISDLAGECTRIAKADWDESELSWDFDSHPVSSDLTTSSLVSRTRDLLNKWKERVAIACRNERAINTAIIKVYELDDEISPEIPLSEISLSCNALYRYDEEKSESELETLLLADTMREFVSYAVGCMLGRYSLDKPGLILANQGETADDYRQQIPEPTFAPDEDNVIPLLDGDWFEDDITERFKEFLKVTFGTEYYDENLTFLENALYPDNVTGRKRKTIRDYFLKDFYNHHIKLYKKRPIYWLFSSPKGTFNALIYMHRYRPDTVSVVLGYLRDFNAKLKAKVESLQRTADSASASATEKTKALKEIVTLKKDIRELDDYERDILYPLATERLEIDLDDGVKVNYPKFGRALKKIAGMDAGDDD